MLLRHPFDLLLLLLSATPLFFIAINDIHGWGDDYAQYIKEASNIASGRPYFESGYIFNPNNLEYAPPSYPPGFSLLLAPVVKTWGIAIRPMLYLVTVMLVVFLVSSYYYFKRHMGRSSAFCLALIGTYCGAVIDLKGHVLADIPLLAFTSVYLFLRTEAPSRARILLLILTACMAILIRTQGILLLAAEMLFLFFSVLSQRSRRELTWRSFLLHPSLLITVTALFCYEVLSLTVFRAPDNAHSFYRNLFSLYDHNGWDLLAYNFNYLVDLLRTLLHFGPKEFFWQAPGTIIEYVSFTLAGAGLIISLRQKTEPETLFFLLMCLLIFILPVHQGARYLLPVLPVYLLLFYRGAKAAMPHLTRNVKSAAMIFTVVFLLLCFSHVEGLKGSPASHPYAAEDSAAFEYIRKHVKENEIIVFAKPRALNLYTGKKSVNIAWQKTPEQNKHFFDSLGVKYLLSRKGVEDEYITQYLQGTKVPLDSIIINDKYVIYNVR